MKEKVKVAIIFVFLMFVAIVSIHFHPPFVPLYPKESLFSLGGFLSILENTMGGFFPYFVKIILSFSLFHFAKRNLFYFFSSAALVFIAPPYAETLLISLILAASFLSAPLSILTSILFSFFSRLAFPAIIAAVLLRKIIKEEKKEMFPPLFGFLSPPLLLSIFKGNLFLPFLLSLTSFPQYMPVKLFSPLFFFFAFSLVFLFLEGKKSLLKVGLSFISYFFNPLGGLVLIPTFNKSESQKKIYAFLFVVPVLILISFPSSYKSFPEGAKKVLNLSENKNFSLFVPPEIYFNAKEFFSKSNVDIKPELSLSSLLELYQSLPINPPLTGYKTQEGDVILVNANYPSNQNLRNYNKNCYLIWCGKDYSLFASGKFLIENPKVKRLNSYSPYVVMPNDIENRKLALAEIEDILKDEPQFFEGLRDRGRIYLDLQEAQKAVESFESALKIQKNAQIYNDLGVAFTSLQRYDEAMNAYLEAMRLSPRDLYPRMNYAYTAMISGRLEEARVVLEDLNRAYPTFYPAYRLHYQVYGRMGEIEKAKEILRNIPKELRTKDENDLLGEK